jgi:hypothetical protein
LPGEISADGGEHDTKKENGNDDSKRLLHPDLRVGKLKLVTDKEYCPIMSDPGIFFLYPLPFYGTVGMRGS